MNAMRMLQQKLATGETFIAAYRASPDDRAPQGACSALRHQNTLSFENVAAKPLTI